MGPTHAAPFEAEPIARPDVSPVTTQVERILGARDVQLYRQIFELQTTGKWAQADALIKRLDNKILVGHVKFQRLMHPTKYTARYSELKAWLARYSDHPSAARVYRLAQKRRGSASAPKRPTKIARKGKAETQAITPKDRKSLKAVRNSIAGDIRNTRLTKAGERLFQAASKKQLSHSDIGRLAESLNRAWIAWGTPEKGLAVLSRAAPLARPIRVTTDWQAGLAAWALKDYARAQNHFSAVAAFPEYDDLSAAGSFWAARAALRQGDAPAVSKHLRRAYDRAPDSFYGLIAARQLGLEIVRNWAPPHYKSTTWAQLGGSPGARRAVALSQVGESEAADNELLQAWYTSGPKTYKAFIALAYALDLPQAQVRIAESAPQGETAPLLSLYPIPSWQPVDGFRADPAMLFALIRQESRFSNRARSSSGARGLMQVMPRTAGYIGKDRRLVRDRQNLLYDPAFNMSLGQRYVNYLKDHKATDGDLIYILAAYNGGPGNVNKWRRNVDTSDPLWFIEHIPLRETRAYVEQVASNYWIYRMSMGLETKTLDRLAMGAWPQLEAESTPALVPKGTILSDASHAH